MKRIISLALAALLLVCSFAGCKNSSAGEVPEFYIASEITAEKKAEAETVLSSFMQAFEENNAAEVLPLLSESFGANEDELSSFFNGIQKLVSAPFTLYDSYYINGITTSESVIKVKKSEDDTNFIELTPASDELFIALYVSQNEHISYMMSVMLANENGKFRIVWINPTEFEYNGKRAPEVYGDTKKLLDENKLLSAYINSCMLGNLLRPGGYFVYGDEPEMEDICYKLVAKVSEKFPLPMTLLNTNNSTLYEIGIKRVDSEGILPLIRFSTDSDISSNAKLEAACRAVLSGIENLSPGIKESFSLISFEVTNDNITDETTTMTSKSLVLSVK